jgi:hypothetical protein
MKSFNKLLIASALLFGIFYGCSKNQQGQTGPQGPQGNTGANGNANVKSVMDSVTSSAGWTYAGNTWYTFFTNPNLNGLFVKNGGFTEVFLSTDKGATWSPLPSTYINATLSAQWTYSYTSSGSGTGIYIYFMWSDQLQHTDPFATYGGKAYFNVVCITPSLIVKYPGTNWSNYAALTSIPELKLNQN